METLNIQKTLSQGISLGMQNALNLILMTLLYLLTCWIPYLNVGTTIGVYKAIIGLSKGEPVKPTAIFSTENYKSLGDFFLLFGLMSLGMGAAAAFMFIPAIVLGIAWSFAMYFFLDKKVSPLKALRMSYDTTCGEKWSIFFVVFILVFGICLVFAILGALATVNETTALIFGLLIFVASVITVPICFGVEAELYKYFSAKADAASEAAKAPEVPEAPEA
jgi:hypothetical protein